MRILPLVFLMAANTSVADPAVIEAVKGTKSGASWRFDVTLSHPDTGWDDYADGWRVLDMDGNVLGTRVLHHPHVNEQPFTRSLSGVEIPASLDQVQIESKESVGGWGGKRVTLDLDNPIYAR
ncbi:hypothetical protein [Cognatishimia activa]|uniref:Uncharacterized protein n=1 Tax=Cognatishimia activa TaxID=1715691 RepID=A0A0P1J3D1_9RHOB|nr:hypothetical protein [Cognatishimia activa]CUI50221.1 hypothetical protein TA5113_00627 [Cognatishimia activa]CUK27364.1 hypothetical protein TA5114_03192 [Cognatishimia activa]